MVVDAKQLDGLDSLRLELRRGMIVLAVLSRLGEEQYGYSLKRALDEKGVPIDEGTLYPLLRRLEAQGLLQSSWRVEEGRPRRYYKMTEAGREALRELAKDWNEWETAMRNLLA